MNSPVSLLFQYKLDTEIPLRTWENLRTLRTWVEFKSFYFGVNHVCTHSKAFLSKLREEENCMWFIVLLDSSLHVCQHSMSAMHILNLSSVGQCFL